MARWLNYFAGSGITRVVDIHHTPIEFNYSHPLPISLRIGLTRAVNHSNCRQRMECRDASAWAGGEPGAEAHFCFEAIQGHECPCSLRFVLRTNEVPHLKGEMWGHRAA